MSYGFNLSSFDGNFQAQLENVLRDPALLDPYQYIQTVLNLRGVTMMAMTMMTMAMMIHGMMTIAITMIAMMIIICD